MKDITVLVKPVSGACNLSCGYCFYRELDPRCGVMSEKTVGALLDVLPKDRRVNIAFQGGEPLLAGVEFYRDFIRRAEGAGIGAAYSLQTNGALIDGDYCRLFKEYGFLIGVSLDGTRAAHDAARRGCDGDGTYDKAVAACETLAGYGIPFDILTVITNRNCKNAAGIYNGYKKRGFRFVQLIPCLPPFEGDHGFCPDRAGLSRFLCEFFDLWYADVKAGKAVFDVREFSELSDMLHGKKQGCRFGGVCTPQLVVEANGDTYPCDFYVKPEYRTGSVFDTGLQASLESDGMKRFIADSREGLEKCSGCRYLPLCRGMCRRMRTLFSRGGCAWADLIEHVTKR